MNLKINLVALSCKSKRKFISEYTRIIYALFLFRFIIVHLLCFAGYNMIFAYKYKVINPYSDIIAPILYENFIAPISECHYEFTRLHEIYTVMRRML